MDTVKEDFITIFRTNRGTLALIVLNFVLSIVLFIFSLINVNSGGTVIKIGYGDIGGYRDGTWTDLIAFPLFAIIFGILHNFIALRIFHKRGGGMAKFFLVITTTLILGTFLVITRLLGEG